MIETLHSHTAELEKIWAEKPGFIGWLSTVNHKRIARRFIVTAFVFFVIAGLMAAAMRLQLARADNELIGPELYAQIFSTHGTIMMFVFAVPIMEAMAIYLVPLMLGTRNMAFPRLNALSYWVYLFGGIMIVVAFILNSAPEVGWFSYTPLAEKEFSPGKRQDVWAQLVTFTEVSALLGAVNVIVTTLKMRAPGMTLSRIPLFVWAQVLTAFAIIFAMPSVMVGSSFLMADRLVSTRFFDPSYGGDPLLWQHIFWFFGHPEVYIIFMPALGMISQILPTFARRPVVGYLALVLSLAVTAFLSFGLWVHHMFTTGLPPLGMSFFTAASMLIAIPTGLQIFCWIATLATGRRVSFATPMLFVIAFFFTFIIGGMTGLMVASVTLDSQLHDTYFVVAHLHYVLIGGAVFPLFAGFYYWFPKFTGRMLSERLGKWNFWLFFVGFHVAFFPMHILGLDGMPRRIYSYSYESGWEGLNALATLGAATIAVSMLLFVINVIRSLRSRVQALDNPWNASSLEWATRSPPPPYNFEHIPVVASRDPLWDENPAKTVVVGMPTEAMTTLVTHLHDARPDHVFILPSPSMWPLIAALAITVLFIGTIFTPWALVWGAVPVMIALIGWFWPTKDETALHCELERKPEQVREARLGSTEPAT